MIKVVIDTNIIVSALLSPFGSPARVLDHVFNGTVTVYYDSRIIAEYQEVLRRPKFNFDQSIVKHIINFILHVGMPILPIQSSVHFSDEGDIKFYEVAESANAYLVTGNVKHFPQDPIIKTPQDFLALLKN